MANLSNINNILRTSSLGVGINCDAEFSLDIEKASANAILSLNSNGGSGAEYLLYSGTSGEFVLNKRFVGDRLTISSGGDATFTGGTVDAQGFRTTSGSTDYSLLTRNSANTAVYIQQAGSGNIVDFRYGSQAAGQGTSAMFINASGKTTFAGDVTINGTTGSSGNALAVNRGSDGSQAIRIQNSGEVVIPSNYLYCNATPVSLYVQNTAVFRGSIVNDGGDVTIGDNLIVTGNVDLKSNAGNATKHLRIWNEGTAANDDAVLSWTAQASRTYSMGIHRDSGNLVITNADASVASGDIINIDNSGNSTFAGKILVGTGATAAASLNAYTQTVSSNLFSALRVIENSGASSYWDIGATGGSSTLLNFYHNGNTTAKISFTHTGGATFAGDVEFDKNVWQDIGTNGGYIMRPNGADYVTTTGAVTGAIEIRIPTGGAAKDDMIKFVVDIYDYATQESITVFIGGYIYQAIGGTTWTNVSAQIIATDSSKNYKVRFGDNGSVHCVWIGETDSTWSYPQILVRDFYGGFATTVEDYLATWDITYVTSFTTVSNTLTNNFPMSHGGTDDAFWSASGANIYNDNSGNVGIGRTDPNARLDIKGVGGSTGLTFETSDASNNQTFYINDGGRAGMQYYPFTIGMASSTSAASGARFQVVTTGGDFVVLNDGKTGIGTTSPDYTLDVAGEIGLDSYLRHNGDSNTFFGFSGNDEIKFRTAGSDRIFINSSGQVGIGTTSPASVLEVYGGSSGTNDIDRYVRFKASNGEKRFDFYMGGTGNASSLGMYTSDGTTKNVQIASGGTSYLNGGNVGIGNTSPQTDLHVGSTQSVHSDFTSAFGSSKFFVHNGSSGGGAFMQQGTSAPNLILFGKDTGNQPLAFYNSDMNTSQSSIGSITTTASATAFNTSSDYRLKQDLKDFNGLNLLNKIKVYDFEWKIDNSRSYGVIAHELDKIIPQAVNGEKDAKEMQVVDYSKLVPVLLKSIQELKEEIQILKTKI